MSLPLSKIKNNLTVIILCGGKGSRLKPLTTNTPKPLIKIKKKTILESIIDHLLVYKFSNIILASGFKGDQFDYFINKNYKKYKIENIKTPVNWDIVQRINFCAEKFKSKYFIVCYGDTFADINFDLMISKFKKRSNKISMACYEMKTNFGIVDIKNNFSVKDFREKPKLNIWFNIGYFLFDYNELKLFKKFSSFKKLITRLSKNNKLFVHKHFGKHITINTLAELEKARKEIND